MHRCSKCGSTFNIGARGSNGPIGSGYVDKCDDCFSKDYTNTLVVIERIPPSDPYKARANKVRSNVIKFNEWNKKN